VLDPRREGRIFTTPAAANADDHVIYNKATDALIHDTNGNAAGVHIATLANHATLTAADFVVL
jgi:Ca2+-binding RTX toxin-like protein